MTSKHLFIHPFLNREEHWGGLAVSASGSCQELEEAARSLQREAKDTLIGRSLPWFIPSEIALGNEAFVLHPGSDAVFLVRQPGEAGEVASEYQASVEAICTSGAKAGLILNSNLKPPADGLKWDYFVLETSQSRVLTPVKLLVLATQSKLMFTGVKTRIDFEWALANQAALVDAEFLIHRDRRVNKPDVLRMHVLQLLSLLTQDAETRELEQVFRQEPKLSYSLLRLVNSAALSLHTQITSFSQAITLLGRRQLQRWLQLLVYARQDEDDQPNPLLQWAALRGRLMELAFQQISPAPQLAITPDCAYMTGIFSLLYVLLNLPMEEIIAQLPIPATVKLALTERAGPLGDLLCAIEAAEVRKHALASEILGNLGITGAGYVQAQLAALDWGHKVTLPLSD